MRRIKSLVPAILVLFAMGAALCPAVSFSEEAAARSEPGLCRAGPADRGAEYDVCRRHGGWSFGCGRPSVQRVFRDGGNPGEEGLQRELYILQAGQGFYQPTDRDFCDFGRVLGLRPGSGWFHVEYNSADGTANKRVSIQKTGRVQKWCTARIFVNDAEFGGKMG